MGQVVHWELCKKFKFDHTNKCYMQNRDSALENETHKILWDFELQTDYLISNRRPDLVKVNKKKKKKKKKRTRRIVNFVVPVDHRVKLKESEKRNKYLHFAWELKKLWNMKLTVIPIVIGVLRTITKGLLQGLKGLEITGQVETIQTTALLRSAKILRRILET